MSDTLVSIGLPVRNGAERMVSVVESVLAQDHQDLQLVITDNASTDGTEDYCRELARTDSRVVYHRHPTNVGLLNNFVHAMRISTGTYFRWVGDDDSLEPDCVSRSLKAFGEDERLVLVTTEVAYTGPDGVPQTSVYTGTALGSDDPVVRFTEMLRMLNESHLLIDPLYGTFRRAAIASIPRRNMLREDEVFAAKLALAGPWAHVSEVLAHRNWKHERLPVIARRLQVPAWQAHAANTLQCLEILRWVNDGAELGPAQRREARAAVLRMYLRREERTVKHRGRKLGRLALSALGRR
jgi:glycosyltransferase involved in cell wall biosynthesis